MTLEEMEEVVGEVVGALTVAGFEDVQYLKEEMEPGDPLPIIFTRGGEPFTLALDVA